MHKPAERARIVSPGGVEQLVTVLEQGHEEDEAVEQGVPELMYDGGAQLRREDILVLVGLGEQQAPERVARRSRPRTQPLTPRQRNDGAQPRGQGPGTDRRDRSPVPATGGRTSSAKKRTARRKAVRHASAGAGA